MGVDRVIDVGIYGLLLDRVRGRLETALLL